MYQIFHLALGRARFSLRETYLKKQIRQAELNRGMPGEIFSACGHETTRHLGIKKQASRL